MSMAQDMMRYDTLARDALRGVVRAALQQVAHTGLPGAHHFYITFKTQAAGVNIDSALLEKYPNEMTIVLEHQFWDLEVGDTDFEVTLKFDGIPKYISVPFSAITQFHDPSVGFRLRFEPLHETSSDEHAGKAEVSTADADATPETGEVVSLDAFRKKPT